MSDLIVTVQKVFEIKPHPNADSLEIIKFKGGWQSLDKIGKYKVGDLVIFVPPDCILPKWIIEAEKIEYLKSEAGRTRTVKLRGTLSEGLILPLTIARLSTDNEPLLEGEDVAEALGITKWEPKQASYQNFGEKKTKKIRYNKSDVQEYTHIQHLKNFPDFFSEDEIVDVTEKVHGTNWRAGWARKLKMSFFDRIKKLFGKYDEWVYLAGSHHVVMPLDSEKSSWYGSTITGGNIYQQMALKVKNKIPKGYFVFGELYGPGIQDLTYGVKETTLIVFDVMKDGKYLDVDDLEDFCFNNGFDRVPVIARTEWKNIDVDKITSGKSILAASNGVNQMREGVVIKTEKETWHPTTGRKIIKSISPEYMTRKNGTEYQ